MSSHSGKMEPKRAGTVGRGKCGPLRGPPEPAWVPGQIKYAPPSTRAIENLRHVITLKFSFSSKMIQSALKSNKMQNIHAGNINIGSGLALTGLGPPEFQNLPGSGPAGLMKCVVLAWPLIS